MKTKIILSILVVAIAVVAFQTSSGGSASDIPAVVLPVPGSPLISFRIQFGVGSIDDPEGKKGLTRLTASMLAQAGTRSRTYEDIVEFLYPMAAEVTARVDKEVTTIIGTVHKDHLEGYYALLMEILGEPAFGADDFKRVRTNQLNFVSKTLRGANDEELGKQALNSFMYEGHPYGTPVAGTVSGVESITLDDVRAHYAKWFTRTNVTIGLAGSYDESLVARLRGDLATLPVGESAARDLPTPPPIERMPVIAVEKECRASAISMGFPISVTRSDPDFYPLLIANSYFGEHRTFNGRLMNRMRQVRGLNYGDYSYIENFIQDGGSTFPQTNIPRRQQFFSIWIRPVPHEQRHFSIRLALWELEKLVREGISEEDFEATRRFLTNYCRLWAQDQDRRLGYRMDSAYYGTDDILEMLPTRLATVTLDQVNEAIRRHLNFENIRIAVVTRGADEFMTALVSNAPSPIEYEAGGMSEEVLAEDRIVTAYRLDINRADSKIVDVEDMFE
ncbi:MAG: insulinase family protein [Candidatus Krumholzibacteriota bacterium]|nr:insulinase family protein [Candidatus Krumholzibacteriota bacterium]